jgi:AraC family transcriptional regulator of adaptative response / DNA-3-methyladenine glycosylase II
VAAGESAGTISLRLPFRRPFAARALFEFLAARAVPGVEAGSSFGYCRTLGLSHGAGVMEVGTVDAADDPTGEWNHQGWIPCTLRLRDLRDLGSAVARTRRLLDLDADAPAIDDALGADDVLGPSVGANPGRRVPGHVDGFELAARAVLGQQVSVAGARTTAAQLVRTYGEPLPTTSTADPGLTQLFPPPEALATADPLTLPMPRSRASALIGLAAAVAEGDVVLDPGADRADVAAGMLALPGIGPWTVAYVSMRALGDPDVFMPTDLGVRNGLEALGEAGDPRSAEALSQRWRPWRSYALQHVWAAAARPAAGRPADKTA